MQAEQAQKSAEEWRAKCEQLMEENRRLKAIVGVVKKEEDSEVK